MSGAFDALYASTGRPSIPPEMLLRALLLQAFHGVRSERQLMERLDFDLLFRWFVGLGVDDPVWDASTFSKNRDRLLEGDAAAAYFRAFAGLLKAPAGAPDPAPFRFDARNRRPPTDPVNAMLSLAYAMLTRHLTVALASVGLDPYRGFYHAPRYGRPALALDVMEPFRPIIADSVVLAAVNTGEIGPGDFVSGATGTALTQPGRRRFVEAFERRLSQETTHPVFGYQLSMRRMLLVQARLLSRFLLGELPGYPHYLPR
jgi:CRISPR-associated endonuclease Cas1